MKDFNLYQCMWATASKEEWSEFKSNSVHIGHLFETVTAVMNEDKDKTHALQERASKSSNLRSMFEGRVLGKFKAGTWLAYGHSLPRKPEDNQVLIPPDVWTRYPKINWEKSGVKGQGLEFINVVVNDAAVIEQASLMQQTQKQKSLVTKKQGRPTVRPKILEAYEALRDSGAVDFSASKATLYSPICDYLSNRYPDREAEFNSLDNSTIRKAFTKQFDLDRSK